MAGKRRPTPTRRLADKPTDAVNPAHYKRGTIETIDAIRAALSPDGFVDYCRGNVMKYAARAGHKGDAAVDLLKAAWYAQMAAACLDITVRDPRVMDV